MNKAFTAVLLSLAVCSVAQAEPQRTRLSHENKFPELGQPEVGAMFDYVEYDRRDEQISTAYARYGLLKNLTLNAAVPYKEVDPEFSGSESGFSDASLGIELKAYEDIFGYPYVIPYATVSFDTGDEDKGLGTGETITALGISIGTVVYDQLHYVADLNYAINGGAESGYEDNLLSVSLSLVWDVSKTFAVIAEGRITDEDNAEDSTPGLVLAGFNYKATESLEFTVEGGAGTGGAENADSLASVKVAYTF